MRRSGLFLFTLAGLMLWAAAFATPSNAQYFGRNKVQYDSFDFHVFRTDRFIIHYYPEKEEAIKDVARMAERWYTRHSRTFLREFTRRKPLIFYANDADFHQTNVIGGFIGEGTGGVTEALKNRVVMPLTGSYADTDHVLGHELVHSFQFDIAFNERDTIRYNLGLLPLWLVEGMAEYLSIGREDTHTAMWLRDAILRDDLPTMQQLTRDMRYFPYRYGQAYMAYVGGKYGDQAVANLFKLAGRAGVEGAFQYALGISTDSLSAEWIDEVTATYGPLMEGKTPPEEAGRRVLAPDIDAGDINLAPTVSPDGNYVAFLSERDIFHINLFVADAQTGEVITSLRNPSADPHMDALRFINSAGSWSPDGRQLAFISFARGDNQISILDVESRRVRQNIAVESVSAMTNPAWSPDGESIAFSGLDGGVSDLYLLNLRTNAVRQLTNDRYADLQPTWSPDGRYIAFTTDRGPGGTDFNTLVYAPMRLAIYDVETDQMEVIVPFQRGMHHNPQFSPDGRNLFFIADHDGFKDVYRLELDTRDVYRITNLATGVSGISSTSPAMSVAAQSGRMMFSVFGDNKYVVYGLDRHELQGERVEPEPDAVPIARVLPPFHALDEGLVADYLTDPLTGLPPVDREYEVNRYSPALQLDYVAPPTVGLSAGGLYGTRLGGGVGFYFSDMLGNRNLAIAAQAQGTLKDVGAQVSYINLGERINYGGTAAHIPLMFALGTTGIVDGFLVTEILRQRIFVDQISGLAQYPLSQTRRLEATGGFVRYGFDNEVEQFVQDFFGAAGRVVLDPDDSEFWRGIQTREPLYFFHGSLAYVGDYSFFGFTSPVMGGRYRFQISPQAGTARFVSALADYRRYVFRNPFTFAVRGMHIGNYGAREDDFFARQYLGYWYYPGFIRGYNVNSIDAEECIAAENCASLFERLQGTSIAMASAEVRVPLFGTDVLGLVNFPYLPTELSVFADAGMAWDRNNPPVLEFQRESVRGMPVVSAGLSARVNILGFLILESYYAYPFQRPSKGWHWGFQLMPGW